MKLSFVSFTLVALLAGALSAHAGEVVERLAKEDGTYWERLMQETEGSVAPTPAPTPPPPTPGASTPSPTASTPATPSPTAPQPTGPEPTAPNPTPRPPTPDTTPSTSAPVEEPTASPTPGATTSPPTPGAATPVPTAIAGEPTASPSAGGGTPAPTSGSTPSSETIADILAGDDRFTVLLALITEAGLLPPFNGDGPLTLFAPTNDAFEALNLPPDVDPAFVTSVLLYHVVAQEVLLVDGLEVETLLAGSTVRLTVTETELKVNDANIEETIEASNGLIYVIDAVLIPPTGARRHLRVKSSA